MKANFDIMILSRDNHKNKFQVLNHDIEHLNFTFFLPHSLISFCPSFSLTFLFYFFPSSTSLLLPSPFLPFSLNFCVCVCVCVCVRVHTQSYPMVCDPMYYNPSGFFCLRDFPGKNTRVGCHFLLQEIFSECLEKSEL